MRSRLVSIAILFLLFCTIAYSGDRDAPVMATQAEGVHWYVKTDGSDVNDGKSWASAKRTIQAAIDTALSGDIIEVAAGVYPEALILEDGITLLGEGAEVTRIEYGNDDAVISVDQVRSGKISGFTIAYTGEAAGVVIWLKDSSVIITENVITGATFSGIQADNSDPQITNNEIKGNAQAGILVHSGGRGTISENVISGNGYDGIGVIDGSNPQISDNEIKDNKYNGILVRGESRGTISGNTLSGNGGTGIGIQDNSNPQILNNKIQDNLQSGILVIEESRGEISGNVVFRNGLNGVEVRGNSNPQITNNEIKGNATSGIYIDTGSLCTISGNAISGNAFNGILFRDNSDPEITGNQIEENTGAGIYIRTGGLGTISGNTISGNGISGVVIRELSDPQIMNNKIEANAENGIILYDQGSGRISKNSISSNGLSGIRAENNSGPQIKHNTIVNNESDGVWAYDNASPIINNNIVVKNKGNGINTSGRSHDGNASDGYPTVSFNNVWGNEKGDYNGIDRPATDISVDPLFVNFENGDYHLQPESPCCGAAEDGSDLGAYPCQVVEPSFSILTPIDGQIFPPGTTSTTLRIFIDNHTGSWSWKLNEAFPTSGPAGGNQVTSGNIANVSGLEDGQTYIVYVVLVDEIGNVSSSQKSVAFSVEESVKRTLSITSVEASPGDHVIAQLSISDTTDIASGDILIRYDTDIVTVGEVEATSLLSGLVVNKDRLGEIGLSMDAAVGMPSGGGVLVGIGLTVSTEAQAGVETALELANAEIYDELGAVIPVKLESGIVKIVGIKGDVSNDGEIRSNDAILTLRIAAGLVEPTEYQKWAADINGDGQVKANDAISILRKAAGLAAPGIGYVASADSPITITLGEVHGAAGETITVPLRVDNILRLAGGDISISYDNSVLRAVDVLSDPDTLLVTDISEPGVVRIAFASAGRMKDKTVAKMRFDILEDAISPLKFGNVELYSADALPLSLRSIDKEFKSWAMPPEHSALLQNYPNPFNPETWIPYQLREGSNVSIRIYSSSGEAVRELDLGYKAAGLYMSQDRAAHWDGKSKFGTPVASGVYFYSIRAGDLSAVRKLIVLK